MHGGPKVHKSADLWAQLPYDAFEAIVAKLAFADKVSLERTCRTLRRLLTSEQASKATC